MFLAPIRCSKHQNQNNDFALTVVINYMVVIKTCSLTYTLKGQVSNFHIRLLFTAILRGKKRGWGGGGAMKWMRDICKLTAALIIGQFWNYKTNALRYCFFPQFGRD